MVNVNSPSNHQGQLAPHHYVFISTSSLLLCNCSLVYGPTVSSLELTSKNLYKFAHPSITPINFSCLPLALCCFLLTTENQTLPAILSSFLMHHTTIIITDCHCCFGRIASSTIVIHRQDTGIL